MRKMDTADAKILKELLKDGRKSFTQIAEECGDTKDTISKRYRAMQKNGIIKGATLQVNPVFFGFNVIALLLFRGNPEKADEIKKYVTDKHYLVSCESSQFSVIIESQNMDELDKSKEAIRRLPTITELETTIWLGVRNIPENIQVLLGEDPVLEEKKDLDTKQNDPRFIPDNVDRQIVDALIQNGRAPFASIAEKIGVATGTVISKYEKLRSNGLIKPCIQIDPTKLGYTGLTIFNLAFSDPSSITSIIEKISKIAGITMIIKTSGRYDLWVFADVRSVAQILSVQDKIMSIAKISRIEVFVRKPRTLLPVRREQISTF